MLHKFFIAQWKYPSSGDWTDQVRIDLSDFGLDLDLESLKSKSKFSFKQLVKNKAKEYFFYNLLKKQDQRTTAPTLVSVIPSVNQSISHSISQSVNPSVSQSVNQSVSQVKEPSRSRQGALRSPQGTLKEP